MSLLKIYQQTIENSAKADARKGSNNPNAHISAEVVKATIQAIRNDADFSVMLDRVCEDKGYVLKITPSGNRSYSEVSVTVEEALSAADKHAGNVSLAADDLAVIVVQKLGRAQAETRRNLSLQGQALRA